MDQETLLAQLKSQVEALSGENEVKASLETIEKLLSSIYSENEAIEEDKILGRVNEYITKRHDEVNNLRSFDLDDEAKLVVQLIPLEAFRYENKSYRIDLSEAIKHKSKLAPLNTNGWNPDENQDGIISFSNRIGYVQLFKNGIVEIVDQGSFRGGNQIYGKSVSEGVPLALKRAIEVLDVTDLSGKVVLNVALVNVKDYSVIAADSMGFGVRSEKLKDHNLLLDSVILDSIESDLETGFSTIVRDFWAAFGINQSHLHVN